MSETDPGTPADAVPTDTVLADSVPTDTVLADTVPGQREPQEEEWPPREWRETTRSAGHRQALYVTLGMVVVFAVLVMVNIWGSHQG